MKTVLITGATSGIGRATAYELSKKNFRLVLCGRRKNRLIEIEKELSAFAQVTSLCFDVREQEIIEQCLSSLPEDFCQIDVLINNAGNAHGLDPVETGVIDDWDAMMDINVKGLLYVSRAIIPQMTERKSGHIINIGSSAGKEVYPKGAVYLSLIHI